MTARLATTLVLIALCGASACNEPQRLSIYDLLEPCTGNDGPADALCGRLEVFEDRQAAAGRQIALKIVVLPALGNEPQPDPLFFLAGGPGQGAADVAEFIRVLFARFQSERDIVLVDQRGTGSSNPLDCDVEPDSLEDLSKLHEAPIEEYRACLEGYDADASLYTTPIAMDDLDDVRRYLGYEKINLYGGSYGTRAALVYMRRYPERVRAVVLDGVAPPDMRLPLYFARDGQRALDLLISDCEADPTCSETFPAFRQQFEGLLERLQKKPARVRLVHPRTGEPAEIDVRRELIAGAVMGALYSPVYSSLLPNLIERASQGDYQGLLALSFAFEGLAESISLGMRLSVLCSEDVPRIDSRNVGPETAGTFLRRTSFDLLIKPCEFWPQGEIPDEYYEPVSSDAPVLILSGKLDPVTPPAWGEHIAGHLESARHVVVPGTGHGTVGRGCVNRLIRQFLDEGSADGLDVSCVEDLERPPFFVNSRGPRPSEKR